MVELRGQKASIGGLSAEGVLRTLLRLSLVLQLTHVSSEMLSVFLWGDVSHTYVQAPIKLDHAIPVHSIPKQIN